MLFEVIAITWDGRPSFKMVGKYGQDEFGKFVLTEAGARFDIPDAAIVMRTEFKVPQPVAPPGNVIPLVQPEPKAEAPEPVAPPKPCPLPRLQPVPAKAPVKRNKPATSKKSAIKPAEKKTETKKEDPKK